MNIICFFVHTCDELSRTDGNWDKYLEANSWLKGKDIS